MKEYIDDVSAVDYTSRVTIENPADLGLCERIKRSTNARICVGRAGTGLRTETYLRYLSDHAAAMDSVRADVDESILEGFGFVKVQTLAGNRAEYITRPDLGRNFSAETLSRISCECLRGVQMQIVIGDGLSAYAVERNIRDIYPVILDGLTMKGYSIGTPIFVKYARVATMDRISEALDAEVTMILIGERPGLITNESLSCYMAYRSSSSKPESQRTVVSNIYRHGTPPVEAGAHIVHLAEILMREKKSGAELSLR
jgi:ethanolamine ammonia-lyase small subunit